jgi:hypothetical protein
LQSPAKALNPCPKRIIIHTGIIPRKVEYVYSEILKIFKNSAKYPKRNV